MPLLTNPEALTSVRGKINNLISYFLEPGHRAKNVALLLASTTFTYSAGSLKTVAAGDIITTKSEGFRYEVLASAATTFDLQTAGGVKLNVLPGPDGSINFRAMNPAANGTTDDYPLMEKLITKPIYRTSGTGIEGTVLSIYLPRGNYFMSQTLDLKRTVKIWGDAGFPSAEYARLTFAANTTGIIINRFNTFNGTVESPTTTGADGTTIQGIAIMSQGGTDITKAGVFFKARGSLRSVYVSGFAGNGIQVIANCGSLDATEGNANCFYIENCLSISNRRHGFYTDGDCANAGMIINLDCQLNGRSGIFDSSFLGNTYSGCHAATNGLASIGGNSSISSSQVNFGGRQYTAHWSATEAQLVATQPGTNANVWIDVGPEFVDFLRPSWQAGRPEGTYFPAFAYQSDNLNARSVFDGCYNELDGFCAFRGPHVVIGGSMYNVLTGNVLEADGNSGGLRANQIAAGTGSAYNIKLGDGTSWLTLSHPNASAPWRLKILANGDLFFDNGNQGSRRAFEISGENSTVPWKFRVADFVHNGVREAVRSAAPTTEFWPTGSYVRNSNVTSGQPRGWRCTAGGTPGTWAPDSNWP